MKGAKAEPSKKTMKSPNKTNKITNGANHSRLRCRKKIQNSRKIEIRSRKARQTAIFNYSFQTY